MNSIKCSLLALLSADMTCFGSFITFIHARRLNQVKRRLYGFVFEAEHNLTPEHWKIGSRHVVAHYKMKSLCFWSV